MSVTPIRKPVKRSINNGKVAASLVAVVLAMGGLAFASEPLYRAFCQVTGYGGTTQVADGSKSIAVSDKTVTVRFDATTNVNLPWRFKPVQSQVTTKFGEQVLAFFEATNTSDKPIVGTATFNVVPYRTATYFNKIDCFCFTEQVLAPGQTVQMPVVFYVDPEMTNDFHAKHDKTITLSYTFYADEDQSAAEALAAKLEAKKKVEISPTKPVNPNG
jgi:cytochrome c oxidase assembly protein subunit 11